MAQDSRYCEECERRTLHIRNEMSGGMGCLLILLSGGLMLPVLLLYGLLVVPFRPYRCQQCGTSN